MKKRLSLIVTSLAVILTLVAVNMRHHHHGEMMHVEAHEQCDTGQEDREQDNNTDHTLHYLSAEMVKMVQTGDSSGQPFSFFMLTLFFNSGNTACPQPTYTYFDNNPPFYRESAYLSWRQQSSGLRGPPCA